MIKYHNKTTSLTLLFQFGEYVSLGKVESVLKSAPVVTDICIYGESTKSYVVALVCPARPALTSLAGRFGKAELTWSQLCKDKDITGAVLREIINQVRLTEWERERERCHLVINTNDNFKISSQNILISRLTDSILMHIIYLCMRS